VPGIAFQPITTDSVMTNFVTFEPNAVADVHRHSEQQIAIVIERGRGRTRGVVDERRPSAELEPTQSRVPVPGEWEVAAVSRADPYPIDLSDAVSK